MSAASKVHRRKAISSPWASEKPKREELRLEKREAVLRAAAACFCTEGLEATTMDDVAAMLGVRKPTVYRLFRDKTALIDACRERSANLFLAALEEARAKGGTAADRLRRYFTADLHLMLENDFGRMQAGQAGADMYSRASREFVRLREKVQDGVREIIREGMANGEFKPSLDPKLTALALASTFNLVALWFDPRGPYRLDDIAEKYFDLFFNGIRGR